MNRQAGQLNKVESLERNTGTNGNLTFDTEELLNKRYRTIGWPFENKKKDKIRPIPHTIHKNKLRIRVQREKKETIQVLQ